MKGVFKWDGQRGLVRDLVRRDHPGRKALPCLIAKVLPGRERPIGGRLAKLRIKICIIESGFGRVFRTGAEKHRLEPRPMRSRQAHGAGLATGVKFASGQRESVQRSACCADGSHLAVCRGIVRRRHHVHAFGNHFPIARNQRRKRPAAARGYVLRRERDGVAQKLQIRLSDSYRLAFGDPKGKVNTVWHRLYDRPAS